MPPKAVDISWRHRGEPVGFSYVIQAFWTDESGQSLTEYASIVALVSLAVMLLLIAFRDELGRIFGAMLTETSEVQEQMKDNPGLGDGAGCPSVGGCKR